MVTSLAFVATLALSAPFGGTFATAQGALTVPADAAFAAPPLTFECWVRLDAKTAYNILVAHETKASGTHWELFTTPANGRFSTYLPGCQPDTFISQTDIVDGQWHYVAMILEAKRVRLVVDERVVLDQALTWRGRPRVPGTLTFGALVDGALTCRGALDEARLSSCARPLGPPPAAPLAADAQTLGLWHFDDGGRDSSGHGRDARVVPVPAVTGLGAGGMSTAYQPLPPREDAAPLRAALAAAIQRAGLTSVDPAAPSDAVLAQWSYDYAWLGKVEYPAQRPANLDRAAVEAQTYDRQALVWPTDGGPLGTVIRRASALAEQLGADESATDLRRLTKLGLSPHDADYRGAYLAACAVRRRLALSNPLLDFDSLLCCARGTFAGSVRTNPTTADVQGGHFTTQYFGFNALPGGGLFVVSGLRSGRPTVRNLLADAVVTNGRLRGQRLDHGACEGPDLSWDGRQVVFAWTANREHRWEYHQETAWHLFKMNVDGTGLTQLTDGPDSDFDPCWLPDGRLAFVSERRGGHIRCFAAYLKVRTYTLYGCDADGGDVVPLSYYETSEWHPCVDRDGKLVYTRWDYTDRENCCGSRLWLCGPDGSDPRAPHGNYPLPYSTLPGEPRWTGRGPDSRWGSPLVEMGIRPVPGSHLYLATGAPHHGEVFGSLVLLDLRVPDDHHMSQVKRVTPEEPFPEVETPGRRQYKWGTPWPLSADFYLANCWEDVMLLDRYGNKELLVDLRSLPGQVDERLRLINPIPLRPRPRPPVLAPRTRQGGPATIAVTNVYDSDLPFPAGTRIKWLRVTQNILKTNHAMGEPLIGYERENTPRIPLGVVPVEADGSAYFEAPPAKELIFQALDERFMAVQSMRSCAFVHPGERLVCQGCHEPPQRAPRADTQPLALTRPPSRLVPELGAVEPISYYRQIKPILDQRCVPCHVQTKRGPTDMSYNALREGYTFWFSGAMFGQMTTGYSGVHGGSRTLPGKFGARYSKIGRALLDANHREVSEADRHALILWLDSNSLRLGSFENEAAQLRGELVWPSLDVAAPEKQ